MRALPALWFGALALLSSDEGGTSAANCELSAAAAADDDEEATGNQVGGIPASSASPAVAQEGGKQAANLVPHSLARRLMNYALGRKTNRKGTWMDDGGDCYDAGRCARLVVEPRPGALHVRSCALKASRESVLPQRFAYKDDFQLLVDSAHGVVWGGANHAVQRLVAVRAPPSAPLGGLRRHRPVVGDDTCALKAKQQGVAEGVAEGEVQLNASALVAPGDLEGRRLLLDVQAAACPPLDETGGHAYSREDHFQVMIFAGGSTCECGGDVYCLSPELGDTRGWAVAVDLRQARAVVRNPGAEPGEGLAHKALPKKILAEPMPDIPAVKQLVDHRVLTGRETVGQALERLHKLKDSKLDVFSWQCQNVAYAPEQWLAAAKAFPEPYQPAQPVGAKVLLNANFFAFMDVRHLPCSAPLGPVVSDGAEVQTWPATDRYLSFNHPSTEAFERSKVADVFVMHSRAGGFVLPVRDFTDWFGSLPAEERGQVNAVTGHRVLREGRAIDQRAEFEKSDNGEFWNNNKARTAVGIQHDGPCPPTGSWKGWVQPTEQRAATPLRRSAKTPARCGQMILLMQFEQRSKGDQVFTFFNNASMGRENRPAANGATMPELQHVMQYAMVDDVVNLDSSGSSSLWTSLRDGEQRSQPSDHMRDPRGGFAYQFRPSPTVFGFADRE